MEKINKDLLPLMVNMNIELQDINTQVFDTIKDITDISNHFVSTSFDFNRYILTKMLQVHKQNDTLSKVEVMEEPIIEFSLGLEELKETVDRLNDVITKSKVIVDKYYQLEETLDSKIKESIKSTKKQETQKVELTSATENNQIDSTQIQLEESLQPQSEKEPVLSNTNKEVKVIRMGYKE